MLISNLEPMLAHATLNCVLTRLNDGRISLAIAPKPTLKGETAPLETPLLLSGTADELDEELAKGSAGALGQLVRSHMSLADQVAQQTALLEASRQAAAAKKPAGTSAPAARPASTAAAAKALADGSGTPPDESEQDDPNKLF